MARKVKAYPICGGWQSLRELFDGNLIDLYITMQPLLSFIPSDSVCEREREVRKEGEMVRERDEGRKINREEGD